MCNASMSYIHHIYGIARTLQTPILCSGLNITKTARWQQINWIKSLSAQGAAYHRHWYNNVCFCVGYSVGQWKAYVQTSILFNWVIKLRIVAQRMLNCVCILKEAIRRKLHSWKHVECFLKRASQCYAGLLLIMHLRYIFQLDWVHFNK